MPVALSVFNGVTSDRHPMAPPESSMTYEFHSRERGDNDNARLLWTQQPVGTTRTETPRNVALHYFDRELNHSLGFLNEGYGARMSWPTATPPNSPAPSQEFVGAPNIHTTGGAPITFPWLMWLNRPYVSPLEMLHVPRERSSIMLKSFSLLGTTTYDPNEAANNRRFTHLLNFFGTSYRADPNWATGTLGTVTPGGNLYQLFDYVQVPSRFMGTDTWLNPQVFSNNTAPGTEYLHPPFNRLSRFRDPGKVNINTVLDDRIWSGIQGTIAPPAVSPGPDHNAMFDTRRGFGTANQGTVVFGGFPTFFSNPLRASDAGALVPLTQQTLFHLNRVLEAERQQVGRNAPLLSQTAVASVSMERNNIEPTLLRSDRAIAATSLPAAANYPIFEGTSIEIYRDSRRSSAFRYGPLARVPNLITTRSNVYAIWITIGYFEVDPQTGTLGQEAGAETGEVQRHRAFYVFDRSIPVAFEPGENHNVDRAIVVRRFLE
jgi:hypothetical protein